MFLALGQGPRGLQCSSYLPQNKQTATTGVFTPNQQPEAVAQKKAEWAPGAYVRVYGHVRPKGGSRAVQSFSVRTVHDFNEVGLQSLGVLGAVETLDPAGNC